MKTTKITNNKIDNKSVSFYFSTDSRHLNLGELLKSVYTVPPTEQPNQANKSINENLQKHENN